MSERISFKQIKEGQSQDLMQGITSEEVRVAVFAMYPEKSPGLMGLTRVSFIYTGMWWV